jgi:membrane protease YdiL (CAAX protease family)
MGVALFAIILMTFMMVQFITLVSGVLARDPAYEGKPFSLELIQQDDFRATMERYLLNGDMIAREALWSGLLCSLLIVLSVLLWKRSGAARFLGLALPAVKQMLRWTLIFLLLAGVLEALMRFFPAFQTNFMEQVLGSTTNKLMLALGVGIMAPVFEELLLRGLLFGSVRHIVDEHAAVAITAGVFTVMHLQYDVLVMLLILPLGIVLGYARSRSGSILVPILLHVLNNMASIFLP